MDLSGDGAPALAEHPWHPSATPGPVTTRPVTTRPVTTEPPTGPVGRVCRPVRHRLVAVAVLLGLALIAGGCGSSGSTGSSTLDGLSARQLLDRANAAIRKERYVSISGSIERSGARTGLDLRYVGEDSAGTITLEDSELEILRVDGTTWFRPSDAFWKAQAGSRADDLIALIDGRWILVDPAQQAFAQLDQIASRDFVDDQVLDPEGTLTKGKAATVEGQECLTLTTDTGTLYLSASDALPVQIAGKSEEGSGKATFGYAEVDSPRAPAQDDQVDLADLADLG